MPIAPKFYCPECGAEMKRRPEGKCPECGVDVREHVQDERERETRIEKVMAVIATIMVLALSLFAGGCSVVEGVAMYAVLGAIVWYWGRNTFS